MFLYTPARPRPGCWSHEQLRGCPTLPPPEIRRARAIRYCVMGISGKNYRAEEAWYHFWLIFE